MNGNFVETPCEIREPKIERRNTDNTVISQHKIDN